MSNSRYVDPCFAVNAPGNCLIGPYQPLGLGRLGPETANIKWEVSGYRTGEPVQYFSHTHVGGCGGPGRLGNIGVMPFVLERDALESGVVPPSPIVDETASLCYYSAMLTEGGIKVERIEIPLGDSGKILTITAPGAGHEMIYIAGATLNGEPLNRAWLRHHEIAAGADLHFEVAAEATSWGRNALPPSGTTQGV